MRKNFFFIFPIIIILIAMACVVLLRAIGGRQHISSNGAVAEVRFDLQKRSPLKCLDPRVSGYGTEDSQIYSYKAINYGDFVESAGKFLRYDLFEMRLRSPVWPYRGRSLLYAASQNEAVYQFIGVALEYETAKYDEPILDLISGSNWVYSEQFTSAGTGIVEKWSRFWKIDLAGSSVNECLALCTYGKQQSSTLEPWRSFQLKLNLEKTTDAQIVFDVNALCSLMYSDEQNADEEIEIKLPEITCEIIFVKDDGNRFVLDKKRSGISLDELKTLANVQLQYSSEFFGVYGNSIENELNGPDAPKIRAWLKNSNLEAWKVSEEERIKWRNFAERNSR